MWYKLEWPNKGILGFLENTSQLTSVETDISAALQLPSSVTNDILKIDKNMIFKIILPSARNFGYLSFKYVHEVMSCIMR